MGRGSGIGPGISKQSRFAFCWDQDTILGLSLVQEQGHRVGGGGHSFMPDTVLDAEDEKGRTPTHLPTATSFELWSN